MKYRAILPLLLIVLLIQAPSSMADKVSDNPGYMNLDFITIPDNATEIQDIDLGEVLLGLAADAEDSGDSALAQALGMIQVVRVKGYSVDESDAASAEKSVQKVLKKLEKEHWNRLVYVKDDEESVTVSTKSVDGKMVGLMVVVFDPSDEVLFVNVVGEFNFGTLFQLAQQFGVEDLDTILEDMPLPAGEPSPAPAPDVD